MQRGGPPRPPMSLRNASSVASLRIARSNEPTFLVNRLTLPVENGDPEGWLDPSLAFSLAPTTNLFRCSDLHTIFIFGILNSSNQEKQLH
jgi:hypothetical protein